MISAFRRWANRPLDRGKALSALFTNQLATPGLGSLVAGRRFCGSAQLLLAVAGFGLLMTWYIRVMVIYYDLMFSDVPNAEPNLRHGLWKAGAVLFGVAWFWSLGTSLSLLREARRNASKSPAGAGGTPPFITKNNAKS